ncbi:MAG: hypothetical protein RLY86_1955 [Pseudomonadota bacterium]|jgi:acyl-CoA thioester hydrolase
MSDADRDADRDAAQGAAALPFRLLFRVRFSECDAQAIVFNARYGDYVDVALTEFQRATWGGIAAVQARGLDMRVVKMTLEWSAPARFDDVLEARVRALKTGTTSFTLRTEFRRFREPDLLVAAETVYVLVDTARYQKTPIPEDLRDRLITGSPGVVVNHAGV